MDGDGCRLGERSSSRGEVETWTEAEGRAASGSHSLPFNLVLVTPQPKPFLIPSLASVKPPFNLLVTPQSKPFWTPSFQSILPSTSSCQLYFSSTPIRYPKEGDNNAGQSAPPSTSSHLIHFFNPLQGSSINLR